MSLIIKSSSNGCRQYSSNLLMMFEMLMLVNFWENIYRLFDFREQISWTLNGVGIEGKINTKNN